MKLDISRNGIRCVNNKDYTSLPMEMKSLLALQDLNISECNLMYLPATIWEITSLLRLNISRNKVNALPPEIGSLTQLQWLNAQQTGLSTLPLEIALCGELRVLMLYGNPLETLPQTLADLTNLTLLNLNCVHLCKTAEIDENMVTMLRTGQVLSEHLPSLIFEIPSMRVCP